MHVCPAVSRADRTRSQFVGGPEQRSARRCRSAGIGHGRIEKEDVVVVFRERPREVPPKPNIDGQAGGDFYVILDIRSNVEIAETIFDGELALGGVRVTQEITGKGTPGRADVGRIGGSARVKSKAAATLLAFLVILIGTTNFPTNIEAVAAASPKPVVVEADAELAVL